MQLVTLQRAHIVVTPFRVRFRGSGELGLGKLGFGKVGRWLSAETVNSVETLSNQKLLLHTLRRPIISPEL